METTVTEQATTPAVETKTEVKPEVIAEPAKPIAKNSKDWAVQLSQVQKLQREREAFKNQQAQHAEKLKRVDAIEAAKASNNPAKILEAAGFPKEKVAEWLLNGESTVKLAPEVQEIKSELEMTKQEFKAYKDELAAKAQEATKAQETEEAKAYRAEIVAQVETDAFPLVKANGMAQRVLDVIKEHHEKTDGWLEPEAAAKYVEDKLAEQLPAYLDNLYSSPKMREITKAAIARAEAKDKPKEEPVVQKTRVKSAQKKEVVQPTTKKLTAKEIWQQIRDRDLLKT